MLGFASVVELSLTLFEDILTLITALLFDSSLPFPVQDMNVASERLRYSPPDIEIPNTTPVPLLLSMFLNTHFRDAEVSVMVEEEEEEL